MLNMTFYDVCDVNPLLFRVLCGLIVSWISTHFSEMSLVPDDCDDCSLDLHPNVPQLASVPEKLTFARMSCFLSKAQLGPNHMNLLFNHLHCILVE